jgi:holo-[acyl-carrier protein] synthase
MIAIGTDILQIDRVTEALTRQGERFMRRILTPDEQEEFAASKQPERLLAKRFAVKEAVVKALGTGIGRGVSWQDIHLYHDDAGAPLVELSGGAAEVARQRGGSHVLVSLADERDYVVAFAALVP